MPYEFRIYRSNKERWRLVDRMGGGSPWSKLPRRNQSGVPREPPAPLNETMEMNRAEAVQAAAGDYEEVNLQV